MFYWSILQRPDDELIKKVFLAQKQFPTKKCWVSKVEEDLEQCQIDLNAEQIKQLSKNNFKNIVKDKTKKKAMEYLENLQLKHKKSSKLTQSLKMQPYLVNDQLTTLQKQLLFKLKCNMTPNKLSYKSQYISDLSCRLCRDPNSEESLEHLLLCSFTNNHPNLTQIPKVKIDDIYGTIKQQVQALKVWEVIFQLLPEPK